MSKFDNSISIPYGAIKRMQLGIWFEYKCTFQFLMVRLKAGLYKTLVDDYVISIPYGAIKS